MKKVLIGMFLVVLALCLCACGSQPAEESAEPATEEAEQAAEPAEDNTAPADAPYTVELLEAQKLTNYDGQELFVVFYNFTNNSEETISAAVALYIKAFQDGVQLDTGYLDEDHVPEGKTYDADWKDLRPGTTLECYEEFVLTSTSDVEVEVTEFASFDDEILASKVYSVQ